MARYASGKNAWGYSDRSGFRYRLSEMMTEWNGSKVGPDEFEPKHEQLEPISPGPDPQALYDPRPENNLQPVTVRFPTFNTVTLQPIPIPRAIARAGTLTTTGATPGEQLYPLLLQAWQALVLWVRCPQVSLQSLLHIL